jgi:hypothetical protein
MDGRSPERSPGKFSPRVYAKYPELDQVLLHYLGIEELIDRHTVNPELFESQSSLNFLTQRFDLTPASTFRAFLLQYDRKYATVRSYFLPGAESEAILLKAAEAGNLEAFYTGIKLYPKYRNPKFLNHALNSAALGGHQVMIDLVKDLGGHDVMSELIGTVEGGHLAKLKTLLEITSLDTSRLYLLAISATYSGQLTTLKYLTSLQTIELKDYNYLLFEAGSNGNPVVIDYLISLGADDYSQLIESLIQNNYVDLALKYLDKPGLDYSNIFFSAFMINNLTLARLLATGRTINPNILDGLIAHIPKHVTSEGIDYLISLGAVNYSGLIDAILHHNRLDLFKQYYKCPGIDYMHVFNSALGEGRTKFLKFMLKHRLIKLTPTDLNKYLAIVELDDLSTFELLFSLGASNYAYVVRKALDLSKLKLADKYFDQANLDLNKLFREADAIEVYKYLSSKGSITQATLNFTLNKLSRSRRRHFSREKAYLITLGAEVADRD